MHPRMCFCWTRLGLRQSSMSHPLSWRHHLVLVRRQCIEYLSSGSFDTSASETWSCVWFPHPWVWSRNTAAGKQEWGLLLKLHDALIKRVCVKVYLFIEYRVEGCHWRSRYAICSSPTVSVGGVAGLVIGRGTDRAHLCGGLVEKI